ncbi:chitobiase/beta-hexosaminidase C-terminal domain-containing protein [Occallatibacter savannae]|uniref:chitobiase/beta-hexosaminidase C-terminal domain-containing protein n=1 Tax=Occallatibacter savannae TaxID=1002691 RepID=UPI0013A553A6|nr:chitobiase/beta-hexosaminidase C-terminal domain-containing protein [Occallatibacter savannae]
MYRKPSSAGVDLLARVSAVSNLESAPDPSGTRSGDSTPSDEAVGEIDPAGDVEVGGLAGALSDGSYSYVFRNLSNPTEQQKRGEIQKRGRTLSLPIPAEGLFKVSIYDRLSTPRIELLIAAIRPPRGAKIAKAFENVDALLKDWNEDYQGWPRHELRRAYLRSVMLGIAPSFAPLPQSPAQIRGTHAGNVACEPSFEPAPGVFKRDTEVKLGCSTPGATIRFTVDGSQPLEGAPPYLAPIEVKGTALTIKAYASAPGKKDSPVVTGIFRIGE